MTSFPIFRDVKRGRHYAEQGAGREHIVSLANQASQHEEFAMIAADSVSDFMDADRKRGTPLREITCVPVFDRFWIEADFLTDSRIGVMGGKSNNNEWALFVFVMQGFVRAPIPIRYIGMIDFGEDGTCVKTSARARALEFPEEEEVAEQSIAEWGIHLALTTFAFCHCKNVDLVERLPKRHEQREAKRRGEPILKYHEIVIDPNRSYATNETSRNTSTAPSKSLHLVRGHFANYSEDKPLFGKYSGTFWVPAHVRGSAEVGEVKSTYRVKAGAA